MSRLRVYSDSLELVRLCRPLWELIARSHPELGKQLRRSVVSVPLNISEGEGRYDGNGRERLKTAMYEAKESRSNLETACAAGFVSKERVAEAHDLADKVAATLFKLVGGAAAR
ncbi:MAG: four helix bundle protein [Sandaracinaceae bacterium]|nr:four helix bundle protein [Sandaracinaceae bacterium]